MSIGAGIFLGFTVFAIVVLYTVTRDRWAWRKIIGRSAAGILAVTTLGVGAYWAKTAYDDRIVPMHTYLGLNLSDSLNDVRFKKGESKDFDGTYIGYRDEHDNWESVVMLKGGKIRAILYPGSCTFCNPILGIYIGTSYNDVVEKLGQPSFTASSQDGLQRWVSYEELNVAFLFATGKVAGLSVYDASAGPIRFIE